MEKINITTETISADTITAEKPEFPNGRKGYLYITAEDTGEPFISVCKPLKEGENNGSK